MKDDVQVSRQSVLRSHLSEHHDSTGSSQSESEMEDDVEVFIPEGGKVPQLPIDPKKSVGSLQSRPNGFNESAGISQANKSQPNL